MIKPLVSICSFTYQYIIVAKEYVLFMPTFSERMGIKPMNTVILRDSINNEIRNGLWTAFTTFYWNSFAKAYSDPGSNGFLIGLWLNYFKSTIDTIPRDWNEMYKYTRNYFFGCKWNEVYDFVEYCPNNYPEGVRENQGFVRLK
jgi:hypothetical protein